MRVLLVEPDYRRALPKSAKVPNGSCEPPRTDNALWYPPLGLMKLSTFHKRRGDDVQFVRGCDESVFNRGDLFTTPDIWDRVYITTLFTFHFDKIVQTIRFYKDAVGGTISKVFVGGIMASLMAEDIYEETGIWPKTGILASPRYIDLPGRVNIDRLPPDYTLLDQNIYAVNDTYYAYATRGCTNKCPWCGVPKIEPEYVPYVDIKTTIRGLRKAHGDKSTLMLMDNNVLASPKLDRIVEDLVVLGYGRGQMTRTTPPKQRVVDFNQGLDADYMTEKNMRLLARLNVKPMRVAFDRAKECKKYEKAIRVARKYGVEEFSNYMLYNFRDTPRDLYERLNVNILMNEETITEDPERRTGRIFSYPMRFAPIYNTTGNRENRRRDYFWPDEEKDRDWLENPGWTPRFIRNIEIMKGAAHGAISPVPTLARRAIGASFEEFLINLYMPEEFLRNRDAHEKKQYEYHRRQPKKVKKRPTGKIEKFRTFMKRLLKKQGEKFHAFHNAVTPNTTLAVREIMGTTKYKELKTWLDWYDRKR